MSALLLLWCCLGLTSDEPPLVGRPIEWPFTGAVAGFVRAGGVYACPFVVTSSASLETVEARQALTLVLRAEARGPVKLPPGRIDLKELPVFKMQFDIEDAGEAEPGKGRWEWRWRLRPKGEWVVEVPGVPFLFYNPDLKPPEKGYQLLWTDPLPLKVEAAETIGPRHGLPPEVKEMPTGDEPASAGWLPTLAALLAPPLGCAAWLFAWRRLWPDAARLARLRQGRAARRAFQALDRIGGTSRQRAEGIVAALVGYLGERLGAGFPNPTPVEARDAVRAAGLPDPIAERLQDLWVRLDAVRFGPTDEGGADAAEAKRLVADLEESLCQPSS